MVAIVIYYVNLVASTEFEPKSLDASPCTLNMYQILALEMFVVLKFLSVFVGCGSKSAPFCSLLLDLFGVQIENVAYMKL